MFNQLMSHLAHNYRYLPLRNIELERWHTKVNSVANLAASKKFKAINTSFSYQMDQVLHDRERIISRSRVKRGDYKILKLEESFPECTASAAQSSLTDGKCSSNNVKGVELFSSIYDDSDFYAVMLKDLIDRKVSENPAIMSSHYAATIRSSRLKRQVDTRASKGRKLRHHVHEKLQSFMAPQAPPNYASRSLQNEHAFEEGISCWPETRVDEFFSKLFGSIEACDDSPRAAEVGSTLRVFG
jgi:protein AATF/BFR2